MPTPPPLVVPVPRGTHIWGLIPAVGGGGSGAAFARLSHRFQEAMGGGWDPALLILCFFLPLIVPDGPNEDLGSQVLMALGRLAKKGDLAT